MSTSRRKIEIALSTLCYVSSDEQGIEIAVRKMGQVV